MDPESPGSRFTSHAALAIVTGPRGASHFAEGEDPGASAEIVADVLDAEEPGATSALGDTQAIDGTYGRGAAGWIPVIEWGLELAIGGVITNVAWAGIKLGARQLRELIDRLRRRGVRVAVSRGSAALVAIAQVLEATAEEGILDVEAVGEVSAVAGRPPSETSYVEIEPWLVLLVNETRTRRYVVAVDPSGVILSWMSVPMGAWDGMYGVLPSRE